MLNKKRSFLVKVTTTALLTAAAVFLNRFLAITTVNTKISLTFVPIIICGMLFGPLWSGACAALGDLIAALLMPLGPLHLGITATALLTGVIYGTVGLAASRLKSKWAFWLVTVAAVLTENILCTLLINSFWLAGMMGTSFAAQLAVRLPQAAILFIPEVVLTVLVKNYVLPPVKKAMGR